MAERVKPLSELDLLAIGTLTSMRDVSLDAVPLSQELRYRQLDENVGTVSQLFASVYTHEYAIRQAATILSNQTPPRGRLEKATTYRAVIKNASKVVELVEQSPVFGVSLSNVVRDCYWPDPRDVVQETAKSWGKIITNMERENIVELVSSQFIEQKQRLLTLRYLEYCLVSLQDNSIKHADNPSRLKSINKWIAITTQRIKDHKELYQIAHTREDLEVLGAEYARLRNLMTATTKVVEKRFHSDGAVEGEREVGYRAYHDFVNSNTRFETAQMYALKYLSQILTISGMNEPHFVSSTGTDVSLELTITINGGMETVRGGGRFVKIGDKKILHITGIYSRHHSLDNIGTMVRFDNDELVIDPSTNLPYVQPIQVVRDKHNNLGTISKAVGVKSTLNPDYFQ